MSTPYNKYNLTCTRPEFAWSINHLGEYSVLRYYYNERFEILVKEKINWVVCRLDWDPELQGWIFPRKNCDEIMDIIYNSFPEWKFFYDNKQ